MCALLPKADIRASPRHVCFVPKADLCSAANRQLYSIALSARASSIGLPFLRFLAGAWDGKRERFAQPLGIHRDFDTRAFLLEQHHRARIAAAPATRES